MLKSNCQREEYYGALGTETGSCSHVARGERERGEALAQTFQWDLDSNLGFVTSRGARYPIRRDEHQRLRARGQSFWVVLG